MGKFEAQLCSPQIKVAPWWWEWAPREVNNPPILPEATEIAVVGTGFTGLSAALELARNGKQVTVFDSGAPGQGASSRNGGQIGSGNQRFTVARLIELFGRQQAKALLNEGVAALNYVGELIEREKLECYFERVGRFRGAIRSAHYEPMVADHQQLSDLTGVEFYDVPKSHQATEIGSDYYQGGVVLPGDANLHPGLYQSELLRIVRDAGVSIVPFTEVLKISRERQRLLLSTKRGEVTAGDVIIATNGYTTNSTPSFHARILPVGSAIIATEPLPAATISRLMPRSRVIGETRRVFYYYRVCPEKRRILFGGRMISPSPQAKLEDFAHLHRGMCEIFPELVHTKVTHCWTGYVGYTRDTFPHMGKQEGLFYALGYCGSGVARATYLGHKLARKMLGQEDGRAAWDHLAFERYLFPATTKRLLPLAVAWHRIRDRIGV